MTKVKGTHAHTNAHTDTKSPHFAGDLIIYYLLVFLDLYVSYSTSTEFWGCCEFKNACENDVH